MFDSNKFSDSLFIIRTLAKKQNSSTGNEFCVRTHPKIPTDLKIKAPTRRNL